MGADGYSSLKMSLAPVSGMEQHAGQRDSVLKPCPPAEYAGTPAAWPYSCRSPSGNLNAWEWMKSQHFQGVCHLILGKNTFRQVSDNFGRIRKCHD